MAREFDDGSSQYLINSSSPVSGEPLTMACWFYMPNTTTTYVPLSVGETSSGYYHAIFRYNNGDLYAFTVGDAGNSSATATAQPSANTWHHAAAVFAANNDRRIYLDGSNKGTNSTTNNNSPDRVTIGVTADNSPVGHMSGSIAEAAIWNVALLDFEVWLMGKLKLSPQWIRPQNLVFYPPLLLDEDYDIVGGLQMTPTNSPTVVSHPPGIIYPRQRFGFAGPYSPRRVRPLVKELL